MNTDLLETTRQVLYRVQLGLKDKRQVQRQAKMPSMQDLLAWCEAHSLETHSWFGSRQVVFDDAVLQRIRQTLSELGLKDLAPLAPAHSRFDQSDAGVGENKNIGLAPRETRVLMAQANCGAYFPEWVTESPGQWVMDMDWRTLQLEAFSHLLVVENLDAFYQYFALHPQRYQLPEQALAALVVYRGDKDESKGCKALREACLAQGKAAIYFGDYDSAGLNIALHGGYSHILLPHKSALLAQANSIAQGAQQIELAGRVLAFAQQLPVDDPLRKLLLHNTQQQKGLRQQAFKGPLQIFRVQRALPA